MSNVGQHVGNHFSQEKFQKIQNPEQIHRDPAVFRPAPIKHATLLDYFGLCMELFSCYSSRNERIWLNNAVLT